MNPAAPPTDHDDELKPMHPKDTKPPPEFSGARKEFMARHASFPHYMNYQQHPYVNGNGTGYPPGDHYQNENYYDLNIRRNKSSNDLITSSSYKDIE